MNGDSMGTLQVVQLLNGQETVLFSESNNMGPDWFSSSVELNGNGVTVRAQPILPFLLEVVVIIDNIIFFKSLSCQLYHIIGDVIPALHLYIF